MRGVGLVACASVMWRAGAGWVDPDSPDDALKTRSFFDGAKYDLVYSDEFEVEGRSFGDGDDPRWTAVEKNDYTNMALHFYHADRVTTSNGVLNISTMYHPTSFQSAEDTKGFVVMSKRTKPYSSGMVQGWNKFCFTGGILEIKAKLPGAAHVGGLWPAMWTLGALARATYVGSTDWMWPWSYDKCSRSRQHEQEINACTPSPHYGMNAFEGRGAPEVDVLEAMPGSGALKYGMKKPYYSASYQVAPGIEAVRPVEGKKPDKGTWYEDGLRYGPNTSMNYFFYGEELKHDRKSETYVADAISANTMLSTTHFEEFHTYRLEWETAKGKEALKWYLDDDFILEIDQSALHKTGAKMPDEPMHVLLNTAVSSTWGFPAPCPAGCDCACYDCGNPKCACALPTGFCDMLPAGYEIDSVRVYQRADEPTHKLGCSTDSKPTKHFIDGHKKRYFDKWSGETQMLKPQARGGATCDSDAECGGGTGSTYGVCRKGTCRCRGGRVGPRCLAHGGFNDIVYEKPLTLTLSAPFVPAPLIRAAVGISALLVFVVVLSVTKKKSARRANFMK